MIEHLSRTESERGFSLIEVLVAASLMLALTIVSVGVINNATAMVGRASEQIEVRRVARESLDLIGRDLALAALPWDRRSAKSLHFIVNPPVAKEASFANKDTFFWQAPISKDKTGGNIAIVGYFVLHEFVANSSSSRFQLRRLYVEPRSGNTDYLIYAATGSSWLTEDLLKSFAPATHGDDVSNAHKGWVADGVLGMWVRCFDKKGGVISNAPEMGFDSRALFQRPGQEWYPAGYSVLPTFVEVTLLCVAPGDLNRLSKLESLPGSTTADRTALQAEIAGYVTKLREDNPGVKSIGVFTRRYRISSTN